MFTLRGSADPTLGRKGEDEEGGRRTERRKEGRNEGRNGEGKKGREKGREGRVGEERDGKGKGKERESNGREALVAAAKVARHGHVTGDTGKTRGRRGN